MSRMDGFSDVDQALEEVADSVQRGTLSIETAQRAEHSLLEARSGLLEHELRETNLRLEPARSQRQAKKIQAQNKETVRCILGIFRGLGGFSSVGQFKSWQVDGLVSTIRSAIVAQNFPEQADEVVEHLANAILTHTESWVDLELIFIILKEALSDPDLVLLEEIRQRMKEAA